ncbi:MAG: class I SAM-dependent methyltransferase [Inquilinus limosus]|uniref:Class I SAM-dependent methyltransferase n=1 Tax=Inquilinus limosus TaxID=171674 RepID=A0A952KFR8_9PROT|nr:class I SAM-dependent methyltransferase [Inquilinus limosus]
MGEPTQGPLAVVRRKRDAAFLTEDRVAELIRPRPFGKERRIAERARLTQEMGPLALWEGYRDFTAPEDSFTRSSNSVRTSHKYGRVYVQLVRGFRPWTVVEIGTAFGVSGMYWLAGLSANRRGRLVTFDPNRQWQEIARANLAAISPRFTAVAETFEAGFAATGIRFDRPGIAFIDGIHVGDIVKAQAELLLARIASPWILVFDDIRFNDGMYRCFREIEQAAGVVSAVEIESRVGILEVDPTAGARS